MDCSTKHGSVLGRAFHGFPQPRIKPGLRLRLGLGAICGVSKFPL